MATVGATPSGTELVRAVERARAPAVRRAGKYYLLTELGRGGTATVHLAVARGPAAVSKLVVLKTLLPEFAEDESAISGFLEEARLAALLNHPNVVQTYEVGTEAGRCLIVMEYLEGQPLSRLLLACEAGGQRLPDGMHLRTLLELLSGLHYSHELKSYEGRPLELVHRDVSPQNVLVTYDGQVKVLDFGIAKATTSLAHTATGVLKGKVSYMAPEQMAGGAVDRRADIFSVGCMLWAAAAGRQLWKGHSYDRIVSLVLDGKIPSPRSVNPYCPAELEAIVMKALATAPEDRYPTALAMQMALEAFTERLGLVMKQRETGAFVSELFASERALLKASVEHALARVLASETTPSPDVTPWGDSRAPESVRRVASAPGGATDGGARATPTRASVSRVSRIPRARRRRSPLQRILSLGSAALVGMSASVVAWQWVRPALTGSPSSAPRARPPNALLEPTLPAAASVAFVVSATPEPTRPDTPAGALTTPPAPLEPSEWNRTPEYASDESPVVPSAQHGRSP